MIGDYLARVNIVSLIPSITLLAGLRIGYKTLVLKVKSNFDIFNSLIFLSIITSFSGYLWFLIMYPSYNGNTIKAVYIIQLFHLMCFLSAVLLEKLRNSNKNFYVLFLLLLTGVFIHNFSAMLSHYQ